MKKQELREVFVAEQVVNDQMFRLQKFKFVYVNKSLKKNINILSHDYKLKYL